jgi:hypothetical protein
MLCHPGRGAPETDAEELVNVNIAAAASFVLPV